jgi:hypothetical protein
MRYSGIMRNAASFIGGAGTGLVLMYLFDPKQGRQRREYVAGIAKGGVQVTEEAISSGWKTVREKAVDVAHATSEAASAFGRSISHAADRSGSIRGGRTSGYSGGGWGRDLAVGSAMVAIGAGVMYLTDPFAGHRRRATARDKFLSGFNWMAHQIERQSRNIWNRLRGGAHQLKSEITSRPDVYQSTEEFPQRSGMRRGVESGRRAG